MCAHLWGNLYPLCGQRVDFAKNKYLLPSDGISSNKNLIGLNNLHHKEYFTIKQASKNFQNYFSELE